MLSAAIAYGILLDRSKKIRTSRNLSSLFILECHVLQVLFKLLYMERCSRYLIVETLLLIPYAAKLIS